MIIKTKPSLTRLIILLIGALAFISFLTFFVFKSPPVKVISSKVKSGGTSTGVSEIQTFFISTTESLSLSDIDLQNIASHQIVLDFRTNFIAPQLARLRQLNAKIKVLKYINAGHVSSAWPDSSYNYIETNHSNWFLLDRNGRKVTRATNPNMHVLDPGNKEYQNWVADRALRKIDNGNDGIFADVFYYPHYPPFMRYFYSSIPINPTTGQEYTLDEWTQAKERLLSNLKEKLGGKILMANGYGTGGRYYQYGARGLLNVTDGVLFEGFLRWGTDPLNFFRNEAQWRKDINALQEASKSGKIIGINTSFVVSDQDTPDAEKYKMYSLASFLLGMNYNSFYGLHPIDPERDIAFDSLSYPPTKKKIGKPLGNYYKAQNVYQRDFTGGKVLVNPTYNTQTLNLPRPYKTLEGGVVSEVALVHHTGMILLKTEE